MKILLLNTWPEWPSSRPYLDHDTDEIWHACNEAGVQYYRNYLGQADIQGLTLVEGDDVGVFMGQIAEVYAKFPFERVVAIDEFTLLPGALVREQFGIPGPRLEQVEPYRNKKKMKECLASGGIRVIRDVSRESIEAGGFQPCVIKRPDGAAARGVYVCRSKAEFLEHRDDLDKGALLEEFVDGDCFHIDGAFNETGFVAMAHEYMNTCYDHYANLKPLGSVGVDDPILKHRLIEFAKTVVAVLPLREGIFHLEVIRTAADELVFLEIACRIGGGEIYSNFADVYDFDLFGFCVASQLGKSPSLSTLREQDIAGWLMLNDFPYRPGIFTQFRCGPLRDNNCMYAMKNLKLGRKISDRDYVAFALRGKSAAAVRESINDLIANVSLGSAPLAEAIAA